MAEEESQHGPAALVELVTSSYHPVSPWVTKDHQLELHVRLAAAHLQGLPVYSFATSKHRLFHIERALHSYNHRICILQET